MKKFLALFLAALLTLSLAACGNGSAPADENAISSVSKSEPASNTESTPPTSAAENSIALNETKTTDEFEVTLMQVDFAKALNGNKDSFDDYLTPTDEPTTFTASEGKTLLMFSADLKYIGKEQLNAAIGKFAVNYGDGYTFDEQRVYMRRNDDASIWVQTYINENGSSSTHFIDFEPLDATHYTLRGYFELPSATETEQTEPLSLTVNILGEKFEYTIR